jgi:hypothetical protein
LTPNRYRETVTRSAEQIHGAVTPSLAI